MTLLYIMRVKESPSPRGSNWTDRDTDLTATQKVSMSGSVPGARNSAPQVSPLSETSDRPRQRSMSSDANDDLESEDGFNPVHEFVSRTSSVESDCIVFLTALFCLFAESFIGGVVLYREPESGESPTSYERIEMMVIDDE